jgi:hypothetical protein
MTRPLAKVAAYRVIASPWNGWLYRGEWYSEEEWYLRQLRRRQWRDSKRRNAAKAEDQP